MVDIDWQFDLTIALMNAIEREHHQRISWLMTRDDRWLLKLNKTSERRAKVMAILEREDPSQLHCDNKHALSEVFRYWEVGDKKLRQGKMKEAKYFYDLSEEVLEEFYEWNFQQQEENMEEEKPSLFKRFIRWIIG